MGIREGETTLINIGNKKALKVQYDLKGDLFGDPILMDQITAGGTADEDWFMDPKFRFLIVQKGDKIVGAVYFYYAADDWGVNIHIAVKREYQLKYSDDVARISARWFKKHPTITMLEIIIPRKSKQAWRFAQRHGFTKSHEVLPQIGDGSSGPCDRWLKWAKN